MKIVLSSPEKITNSIKRFDPIEILAAKHKTYDSEGNRIRDGESLADNVVPGILANYLTDARNFIKFVCDSEGFYKKICDSKFRLFSDGYRNPEFEYVSPRGKVCYGGVSKPLYLSLVENGSAFKTVKVSTPTGTLASTKYNLRRVESMTDEIEKEKKKALRKNNKNDENETNKNEEENESENNIMLLQRSTVLSKTIEEVFNGMKKVIIPFSPLETRDLGDQITFSFKILVEKLDEGTFEVEDEQNKNKVVEKKCVTISIRTFGAVEFSPEHPAIKKVIDGLGEDWETKFEYAADFWWQSGGFPLSFDFGHPMLGGSKHIKTGTVKLDGTYVWIPTPDEMNYDNRKEVAKVIASKEGGNTPKYLFIGIDTNSGTLCYYNSEGKEDHVNLATSSSLSNGDVVGIYNFAIEQLFTISSKKVKGKKEKKGSRKTGIFSLNRIYDFSRELQLPKSLMERSLSKLKDVLNVGTCKKDLISFLNRAEALVKDKFNNHQITTWTYFNFIGVANLLIQGADRYVDAQTKVNRRRERIANASAKDLPHIPFISTDYLNHQANAIAKLNVAGKHAIIDVGTGGGKTLIIISDILNLMGQGKIKRPLVIMPTSLCGQFASEITKFTKGRINPLIVNSETNASWGSDRILEMIDAAPKNTIFISSYSYLTNDSKQLGDDITIYPKVDDIKDHIKPDYVVLDEAHSIKNTNTSRNQAVMQLSDVEYRRLSTGTLIANKPTDLPGQLAFLDQTAVGDIDEFVARYAIRGDAANGWRPEASQEIIDDVQKKMGYLNYREKDWASYLPNIKYKNHFVNLTETQQTIYNSLVTEALNNIYKNDNLNKLWQSFKESVSDSENAILGELPATVLAQFQKLEMFVNAPKNNRFLGSDVVNITDKISPKIKIIDELIDESVKEKGKVIIGVHYNSSARQLLEASKYYKSNQALFYNATHKDALQTFVNNSRYVALFAVMNSLAEGFNLTVANRIIIADIDWTPGKAKQFIARAFRPSFTKDGKGNLVNSNVGKTVYVDTILADGTVDCLKWSIQTYKKILNARIMEKCPVESIPAPRFGKDDRIVFLATHNSPLINGVECTNGDSKFNNWFVDQIETERNLNPNPIPVVSPNNEEMDKVLRQDNRILAVPWSRGMTTTHEDDELTVEEYVKENVGVEEILDYRWYRDILIENTARGYRLYVRTDMKKLGYIHKVTSAEKVSVLFADGTSQSYFPESLVCKNIKIKKEVIKRLRESLRSNDKLGEDAEFFESTVLRTDVEPYNTSDFAIGVKPTKKPEEPKSDDSGSGSGSDSGSKPKSRRTIPGINGMDSETIERIKKQFELIKSHNSDNEQAISLILDMYAINGIKLDKSTLEAILLKPSSPYNSTQLGNQLKKQTRKHLGKPNPLGSGGDGTQENDSENDSGSDSGSGGDSTQGNDSGSGSTQGNDSGSTSGKGTTINDFGDKIKIGSDNMINLDLVNLNGAFYIRVPSNDPDFKDIQDIFKLIDKNNKPYFFKTGTYEYLVKDVQDGINFIKELKKSLNNIDPSIKINPHYEGLCLLLIGNKKIMSFDKFKPEIEKIKIARRSDPKNAKKEILLEPVIRLNPKVKESRQIIFVINPVLHQNMGTEIHKLFESSGFNRFNNAKFAYAAIKPSLSNVQGVINLFARRGVGVLNKQELQDQSRNFGILSDSETLTFPTIKKENK